MWGPLDLSRNPFRLVCRELATLYTEPPAIRHGADVSALLETITATGLWSGMPRVQSLTIGLREYAIRVTVDGDGLRYRPVPPDLLVAASPMTAPDQPDRIAELRWFGPPASGGDKPVGWCWEVHDISNREAPNYGIFTADRDMVNVTASVLGGAPGSYPWRKADGTPVLPYVLYHAERRTDRLWDAFEGSELVEGAFNIAILHSFWMHLVKDVSWAQRYGINVRPAGLESVDGDGQAVRQEIVTDPSTLLVLEPIVEGSNTSVGSMEPGGDPESLLRAVQAYAMDVAVEAGVSTGNIQRTEGPSSGYAISLNEAGKRQAQKRFAPHFRWADEQLVTLSAIMLNRATATSYPEDGYTVSYASIPMSPEEMRALREHVLSLVASGMMSPIDAYRELHGSGMTREQAEAELLAIGDERAKFDVTSTTTATGTAPVMGADGVADPQAEPAHDGPSGEQPVPDKAATALNGAQVQAAQAIIMSVAAGALPRDSGVSMLVEFFQLSRDAAEAIMGTIGRGFVPALPAQPQPMNKPAPADEKPQPDTEDDPNA
jgi:hypothetical protein